MSRTTIAGQSIDQRPIELIERGDPDSPRKLLVVGCIHGDEPAGIAVTERLESTPLPPETDVWIVENANPDGFARSTRTNADGVDLNRNFPWHWRRQDLPGNRHYSGPHPLSEPESRLLARLVLLLRPSVSIWFHQPYGLVDESGGNVAVERRFATVAGLPLRRLARYPGGVTNWENARLPGSTAFVVELPGGNPAASLIERVVDATQSVASGP
ncbi:MAG: murein peptide amidase [Gaiellaceae bacterium]|nr:murein peptide amidase [Gaiellaceae bacterium]